MLLDDLNQLVLKQDLPLHHGLGSNLLHLSNLLVLGRLLSPQPLDHLLFVLGVDGQGQLELGQLLPVPPDDVLPSVPS